MEMTEAAKEERNKYYREYKAKHREKTHDIQSQEGRKKSSMDMTEAAKEERRKYDREYYAKHREKAREKMRRYWEKKARLIEEERDTMAKMDNQNATE